MSFEPDRVFAFVRHRLRNDGVDDAAVARVVEESLALAPMMGVEDDAELIRLVLLQFRFSEAQLADPQIVAALTKALGQSQWTATQRMDFIDAQLVGRTPAPMTRGD
ncbi:MAG: hypothetical protein K0V04_41045 [Deltaproteobacteria bacterium]|nr:hypothetical protein [Deltaproteobacteria bacterium]